MKEIKFGIIGVGNRGTEVAQRILQGETHGLKISAVADRNSDRIEWAKQNIPEVLCFNDGIELLDSGGIEAVIIATPHYDHPQLCLEALKRNIHTMCEKPAGVFTKNVREVIEYSKTCPATFAMMFNQRTNCVYRKMKEIVSSGEMGNIRRVSWLGTSWFRSQSYYDSGSWRATWDGEGGGVLANQCPHNLDLLQWICGMPTKVRAFTHNGKWHNIEVEDDVSAYMEFPNGATGSFITTTGDAPGTNRLEITLDGGSLICDSKTLIMNRLSTPIPQFMAEFKGGFGRPACETFEVETDGLNEQTSGVLNAFAEHILYGKSLIAEGAEGINGLILANAIHLSSWLDKTIELPLDEDLFLEELNKRRAASVPRTTTINQMMDISQSR